MVEINLLIFSALVTIGFNLGLSTVTLLSLHTAVVLGRVARQGVTLSRARTRHAI